MIYDGLALKSAAVIQVRRQHLILIYTLFPSHHVWPNLQGQGSCGYDSQPADFMPHPSRHAWCDAATYVVQVGQLFFSFSNAKLVLDLNMNFLFLGAILTLYAAIG